MKRHFLPVKQMILCAMFVALITIGAYIRIPSPLVPLTFQYFMTIMAGMLLGRKYGAFSVLMYIMLGLAGVPVFATGGGFAYVLKPTFGYMVGFVPGAYIMGVLVERMKRSVSGFLFAAAMLDTAVVYFCGTVYFWIINTVYLNTTIGFMPLLISCVITPLPKDMLLCVLAASLGKRLIPLVRDGTGR